ncbi:MAG: hypothetical protein U9R74_05530 [Pseudomonadota bacterium]|nr:hypothetical protein [Pseudomonadota bacterium]
MGILSLLQSSRGEAYGVAGISIPDRLKNLAPASLAATLITVLAPSLVWAEAWELEPEFSIGGNYNTNFRLSTTDPDEVGTGRVAGALKFSRLTESFELAGLARLDFVGFVGDTDRLSNTGNQLFGFESKKKFERSNIGLDALWKRDTVLRSIRVVGDPDNPAIEPDQSVDDNIVNENIRRNAIDVRLPYKYDLTERDRLGARLRFNTTLYEENDFLDDYRQGSLRLDYNHELTEKDNIIALFQTSRFDSDSGRTTDNYELQAGYRYAFSETTSAGFTAGGRYTVFDNPGSGDDGTNTGFVARLQASKITGKARYDVRLERNLSPSGVGDLVETDELNANMSYQLQERWTFAIRSRLFENENIDNPESGSNRRFFSLLPVLSYRFTPDWRVETAYRYLRQKRFSEPTSADSHTVFLNVRWTKVTPIDTL